MSKPGPRPGSSGRFTVLAPIAKLVTRHPRLTVVAWVVAMSVLALIGKDLDQKISAQPIYIQGSATERAHQIAVNEFGSADALVVMLRGPRREIDRQGSELVERLNEMPETLTISPWSSSGSIDGLRPRPGVAAILVSVGQPSDAASATVVPAVQRQIEATVESPVRVDVAGGPAIVDSLRESIKRAAMIGELLAIPALLIVLLFVCRSLIAAAMPVVVGGVVAGATRGVLDLFAETVAIDPIALGTAGMIGLALGVDYSLLVVSRFREEMEKKDDVRRAVEVTVMRTGRSILPAGIGLVVAMLASLWLIPGTFIVSVSLAVSTAAILSVVSALLLAPAALMLVGRHLNRWALPRRREHGALAMGWSRRMSRRPGVVLGMTLLLVFLGVWSFSLQTSTGRANELPPDDPGRIQQEAIERELGPGWVAPYEIMMEGGDEPVTTPERLKALAAFQRRIERDPGVLAMAGFAGIEQTTSQLGGAEDSLAAQQRGLTRLGRGLARVEQGSAASTSGLSRAADGAGQLDAAAEETHDGSGLIVTGLRRSSTGSSRLSGGLGRASDGSGKLTDATAKASDGAGRLAAKISEAREQSGESVNGSRVLQDALRTGEDSLTAIDAPLDATEAQIDAAWQALQRMTSGRDDPQYSAAVDAVRAASVDLTGSEPGAEEGEPAGVVAGVERAQDQFSLGIYLAQQQGESGEDARDGVNRLAKAAARLDHGLQRLTASSGQLTTAIGELSDGSDELSPALRRLTSGAEHLTGGLGQLASGAGGLAGGLAAGVPQSERLTGALAKMRTRVAVQKGGSQLDQINASSPGLFRSGYFYLASLDGSRPEQRNQAGLLVALDEGGSAARMLVIPKDRPLTEAAAGMEERITRDAAALAAKTGAEVVVGGFSPSLVELNDTLREQAPPARIVLSLVTILILLPVTRSLTLALLAAVLNLLTVSAVFGLLALLFNDSLLGGPGFVDTGVIPATVILTFGLAIDYEAFILARMREEYLRTGSTSAAIENGLGKTAHVISGAAVIMIAVFLAFAVSPLANLRNLGVSQALGVFIDAFIIRFILLPAIMRALGDRCWWIPRWLDRILPGEPNPRPGMAR
jgi:putative drug exporter of the RND superfamily